jgi:hypothetical protein
MLRGEFVTYASDCLFFFLQGAWSSIVWLEFHGKSSASGAPAPCRGATRLKLYILVVWQYLGPRSCFLEASMSKRSLIVRHYSVKDVAGPHPWLASIAVDSPDLRHQ